MTSSMLKISPESISEIIKTFFSLKSLKNIYAEEENFINIETAFNKNPTLLNQE